MLLRRHAVSGLINVNMTPEFTAKLGAAYGATLLLDSTVVAARAGGLEIVRLGAQPGPGGVPQGVDTRGNHARPRAE